MIDLSSQQKRHITRSGSHSIPSSSDLTRSQEIGKTGLHCMLDTSYNLTKNHPWLPVISLHLKLCFLSKAVLMLIQIGSCFHLSFKPASSGTTKSLLDCQYTKP